MHKPENSNQINQNQIEQRNLVWQDLWSSFEPLMSCKHISEQTRYNQLVSLIRNIYYRLSQLNIQEHYSEESQYVTRSLDSICRSTVNIEKGLEFINTWKEFENEYEILNIDFESKLLKLDLENKKDFNYATQIASDFHISVQRSGLKINIPVEAVNQKLSKNMEFIEIKNRLILEKSFDKNYTCSVNPLTKLRKKTSSFGKLGKITKI